MLAYFVREGRLSGREVDDRLRLDPSTIRHVPVLDQAWRDSKLARLLKSGPGT